MTPADTKAPLPDDVENAFTQLWDCAGPFEMPRLEYIENNLRAHVSYLNETIAALTAELETYRRNDAGGYYSNRKDRETD